MFKTDSNNGFSLKAYRGSQMTLLAMDLKERPAPGKLAGFTIGYTSPKGETNFIQNMINFMGTNEITGSDFSPFQAFRWVHFPGSYHQEGILTGDYTYFAAPRYFDADGKLDTFDRSKCATVPILVDDYSDRKISVGFTRAFLKSQAFSQRYGYKQPLAPAGTDWLFKTAVKAGSNPNFGSFTYEDMYGWLGFNARKYTIDLLREALADSSMHVDMFAYDFNEPVVADLVLQLASHGRITMILDDASLHHAGKAKKTPGKKTSGKTSKSSSGAGSKSKAPKEDDFEKRFNAAKKGNSAMFRTHFSRFAHCKEIILSKNDKAFKVLTGSTNFSTTGFCVNANHVILFDDDGVAGYYKQVFDACLDQLKSDPKKITAMFTKSKFANNPENFTGDYPATTVNYSPHVAAFAKSEIDAITKDVTAKDTTSVLFSVMDLGTGSGSLIPALKKIHTNDSVYSYGVTDNDGKQLSLYKPGSKDGLLINAKAANAELPPPFAAEHSLPGHAIHHKFIVINFNDDAASRVYCGSSNLAELGEQQNGDNLLCIKGTDAATVFAIEALRLVDHYNFRSVKGDVKQAKTKKKKPAPDAAPHVVKLDSTGAWVDKFYNEKDIRSVERKLFA